MAGWVEGIRRALVLGLVLIAGTAIEHAPSIGPRLLLLVCFMSAKMSLPGVGHKTDLSAKKLCLAFAFWGISWKSGGSTSQLIQALEDHLGRKYVYTLLW